MKTVHYMQQLVKYNVWANTKVAEILRTLTTDELQLEIISSFSSIQKTVLHIWDAEFIWLNRINGIPITTFPSKAYSKNSAIDAFVNCSIDWQVLMENKSDAYFDELCSYTNLQQKVFSNRIGEIVIHCMNHSTYHRGQLITMFRQLGKEQLPSTDFITFLREN
ncbi:MAG: DinB family protein [Bacteroidetes bacterium]|nr:DinB family protein [Bacteroidota bacterium]